MELTEAVKDLLVQAARTALECLGRLHEQVFDCLRQFHCRPSLRTSLGTVYHIWDDLLLESPLSGLQVWGKRRVRVRFLQKGQVEEPDPHKGGHYMLEPPGVKCSDPPCGGQALQKSRAHPKANV